MIKQQNAVRQTLEWKVSNYDLAATLRSGQSFCWRPQGQTWHGWIHQTPCLLSQNKEIIRCESEAGVQASFIEDFLQIHEPIQQIRQSFPENDPWIQRSIDFCPGIRILKSDPWETTCMFICSAMKQVRHIEQMNDQLRIQIGKKWSSNQFQFPTPQEIANSDESAIRACGLGFRAPHLLRTARAIHEEEISLDQIHRLSTTEARIELMKLRGVGEKVANCILLYAYHRLEVVPIDVWIERILKRLYLTKRRKLTRVKLQEFADHHFGPYAGYAQQYLFHWVRMTKGTELP
ncbi:MAG: DNA glycosylase [Verrucomicrobiota bacterium]